MSWDETKLLEGLIQSAPEAFDALITEYQDNDILDMTRPQGPCWQRRSRDARRHEERQADEWSTQWPTGQSGRRPDLTPYGWLLARISHSPLAATASLTPSPGLALINTNTMNDMVRIRGIDSNNRFMM